MVLGRGGSNIRKWEIGMQIGCNFYLARQSNPDFDPKKSLSVQLKLDKKYVWSGDHL